MWKTELVQDIFEEGEANMILKTPTSTMETKDKIIWHGTMDGSFSVKSAYHMEKSREVAYQVKLRRVCQEALPTKHI